MAEYDKSSKWLIQHHGDSILRLAQVRDIESWWALQAELVQPRQLPDGLLEARIRGQAEPHLFPGAPGSRRTRNDGWSSKSSATWLWLG